jgi:hypothetical protein
MVKMVRRYIFISSAEEDAIKAAMREYWKDKIAIVWSVADAHRVAGWKNLTLIDEEAIQVLQQCLDNHDAEHGISWDDIDFAILELGVGSKKGGKDEEDND